MIILKPNPGKQTFSLQQPYSIKEILYGGARGGGKTFAGILWMSEYVDNPRFQGLVIRKNSEDLVDWIERARYMYSGLGATITGKPTIIRFPSGAIIRMGHLKDDSTYTKYQGHEYQKMLIEELTQIQTEDRYMKLITSCRSTVPGLIPQIFATANPGGVGHLWVKHRFIDAGEPNKPFVGEDGLRRIYIPATIDDNPQLMEGDPEYVKTLDALKFTDEALWRAWRYGDWDVFVGQVFSEWRKEKDGKPWHVINELGITMEEFEACPKYVGYDWGYNDPASAHWILILPENEIGVKRMIIYREMYEGQKTPREWAYQLAEVFKREPIKHLVLPHDAYSHLGGNQTIVSVFEEVFKEVCGDNAVSILRANSLAAGARMNRQGIMHQLLSEAPDGLPYIQAMHTCKNFIRTLPALPYSTSKPEEIDEHSEDHPYDSSTYGLMTILEHESMVVGGTREMKHKKDSFYMNNVGTMVGLGLDISKSIERSQGKDQKDWRYR